MMLRTQKGFSPQRQKSHISPGEAIGKCRTSRRGLLWKAQDGMQSLACFAVELGIAVFLIEVHSFSEAVEVSSAIGAVGEMLF